MRFAGLVLFVAGLLLTYPPLREFRDAYLLGRHEVNPDRLGDWAVFAGVFLFASLVAFIGSNSFLSRN